MSREFRTIISRIGTEAVQKIPDCLCNRVVECMHELNELSVRDRPLMSSLSEVGDGERQNHMQSGQFEISTCQVVDE